MTTPIDIDFGQSLKAIVLGQDFAGDITSLLGGRAGVDMLCCWWGDGAPMLIDRP